MKRTLVAALLVGTFAASPAYAAADPPQEPGVTLRTYDIGQSMSKVCELKPGQTPNVDKLMATVDWSTTEQFGLNDNFITHALANLDVTAAGAYKFRLTSDDGSKLFIDDKLVIDHDGLHDVEPPGEGEVELTAGTHKLRVEHFDRTGGQRLTLTWQPPGAGNFAVVPNTVLSTDAGVVRVTAPGAKECVSGTDTPGDGLPLTAVNPGYDLTNLRPAGFEPQVSGIAWRPDGKMVISTWGGTDKVEGEVYLVENVTGKTGPDKVKFKKIATGLKEPMGIAVVDGLVYVSQKHELTELKDTNRDDVLDTRRTVAVWPFGGNFHEFAFGLLYKDGNFYANLSVSINLGGATTDPQPAPDRGNHIVVNRKSGKVTMVAGGLRTPNGIGWGNNNDIYVTDNQGGWLPSSKLLKIKEGAFYNHYTNPDGRFDTQKPTKPVLWLPQNQIANSPSTPVMLKSGTYKGQLLIGDVTYGGLQRAALETVNGQEQGAVFRHTQGLEAGVNRVSLGPDGALYIGGLGADGNWGQNGKLRFGLQKLTPNNKNVFDMKTMKATSDGFKIEYTKPLSPETIAKLPSSYAVEQWRYVPTAQYGGPEVDRENLAVTAAKVSSDRKTVTLTVAGLRPDRVVHLRSPRPFAAADGETLWSTEAWYTMNELPGNRTQQVFYEAEEGYREGAAGLATEHRGFSGVGFASGFGSLNASTTMHVTVDKAGDYAVGLRYSNGPNPFSGQKTISLHVNERKIQQLALPSTVTWAEWATVNHTVTLKKGLNEIQYRVDALDTGHVNLDMISLRAPSKRLALFDGKGLDNWIHTDGRRPQWTTVPGGAIEVNGGDLRTKEAFGDYKLHVEFRTPLLPPEVTGQDRGNSGVYQQERYELQILDSYGDTTPANNEAGAFYTIKAADANMAKPPLEWQTYDITFRAARYDAAGKKTENARVSVIWNGRKVHDNLELPNGTGGNIPEGPATGAIRLQDHGNKVQFRNIWIEPAA